MSVELFDQLVSLVQAKAVENNSCVASQFSLELLNLAVQDAPGWFRNDLQTLNSSWPVNDIYQADIVDIRRRCVEIKSKLALKNTYTNDYWRALLLGAAVTNIGDLSSDTLEVIDEACLRLEIDATSAFVSLKKAIVFCESR